jgi:hypothetical protein
VTQYTIDPRRARHSARTISISNPGAAARRFGFVPDFEACLPGDLILFRDVRPSWTAKAIMRAQGGSGFHLRDGQWTHAAVFLYDHHIVEAVPNGGVKVASLYDCIPNRILRVRRREDLTVEQRFTIGLRASTMIGRRYSPYRTLMIGWEMMTGLDQVPAGVSIGQTVICSKVYADSYSEVTKRVLQGCTITGAVTPAHLSFTADLQDVPIEWLRLN